MDDKTEQGVPEPAENLMSEANSKTLESALLIGDGIPLWLVNVVKQLTGTPQERDDIFLALLTILMYESGFYLLEGPHNQTHSFDIRVMRQLIDPHVIVSNIKTTLGRKEKFIDFSQVAMHPKTVKVISYPMTTGDYCIVINFLVPESSEIYTFLYDISSYICVKSNQIKECSVKQLSIEFKTFLYHLKGSVYGDIYHPHHLITLPPDILGDICKYLKPSDFVRFLRTCKYLYTCFNKDDNIWKRYSKIDFRNLNKKPNETWKDHYRYQMSKTHAAHALHFFPSSVYFPNSTDYRQWV